jgi:hypothetical protein
MRIGVRPERYTAVKRVQALKYGLLFVRRARNRERESL